MRDSVRLLRSSSGVTLALALIVLAHALYDRWQFAAQTPTIDFYTFWSVPHSLSIDPVDNIYETANQKRMLAAVMREVQPLGNDANQKRAAVSNALLYDNRLDATGSPLLYTLVGWMSSGEYDVDQKRFLALSCLALIVAVVLTGRLLGFSPIAIVVTMIVLLYCNAPLVADIGVGNTNAIQFFLVTLFIVLTAASKPFLAGFALGSGVMFKPNTAVIVLLTALLWIADGEVRRQVRMIAGMAAAAAVSVLVSSLYFGRANVWLLFGQSLPRTLAAARYPLENGNFALTTLVSRITQVEVPEAVVLALLLSAFIYAAFSTRPHRMGGAREPGQIVHQTFASVGIGCAIMLLASPLAWLHYYVLLLPAALYLIRPPVDAKSDEDAEVSRRSAGLAVLVILSPLVQNLSENVLGSQLLEATMLNTAAILMFVVALLELRRCRMTAAVRLPVSRRAARAS